MSTSTDYRITIRANASADDAFNAVTNPAAIAAWWSPVDGSGLAGGELRFPMVAEQPPLLVHVLESTRPATARWRVAECTFMRDWEGTEPTFVIAPTDGESCEVTFVHVGLNDDLDCKDMCSRSWDHFVGTSLLEFLEGGSGAPNRSPRDLARRAAEAAS